MALTDEQRGPRASYLNRHLKRYGTGDGALKKLAADMEAIGFSRSWSTYKGWVSSDERSPIPPEAEPYFLRLFGEPVPPSRTPAPTQAELIAALSAQTSAITDLVNELRLARLSHPLARDVEDIRAAAARILSLSPDALARPAADTGSTDRTEAGPVAGGRP